MAQVYSLYQLTCGYSMSAESFNSSLYDLLTRYYNETGVCLTVNSTLFSQSMYPGKYACAGEPVAMVFVSVNPSKNPEGAGPHVQWLADALAKMHGQYVVPCSAVSPANTTIVGRK